MKKTVSYLLIAFLFSIVHITVAQEDYMEEIAELKQQKEQIETQEREALKEEVESINARLDRGSITEEEAKILKESAAEKRAKNIQDRKAIIDSRIALLERNKGVVLEEEDKSIWEDGVDVTVNVGDESWEPFDWKYHSRKYDRRTYSNFVIAFGLNNVIPENGSLNDSPYSAWRSRFFEIGWAWRTRIFNNTNFMRFHYGFSFTFNGLRNTSNLYYTQDGSGQVVRETFPVSLSKSKLRTDNLIVPLHFEFGPSRKTVSETRVRYSSRSQFKIAVGGYGGINLGTRQKLKYRLDGEKIKEKSTGIFNPNQFVYGLSGWIGVGCVQFNVRYDLHTILKDWEIQENNISFGLRFEI
ncbi:MAG: hypothetical protein ACR2MM_01225 [Flavobacteriaceae bacterium]